MQMISIELAYLVASIVGVTNHIRHEVDAKQDSCDAKQFAADSVKTYGSSDEAVKV